MAPEHVKKRALVEVAELPIRDLIPRVAPLVEAGLRMVPDALIPHLSVELRDLLRGFREASLKTKLKPSGDLLLDKFFRLASRPFVKVPEEEIWIDAFKELGFSATFEEGESRGETARRSLLRPLTEEEIEYVRSRRPV